MKSSWRLKYLLFLAELFSASLLLAQNGFEPEYRVVHVEGTIKLNSDSINSRLKLISDKKQLVRFLKRNLNQANMGSVWLCEKKGTNDYTFYRYSMNTRELDDVDNITVLAGKGLEIKIVEKREDFRVLFADSLLIFDSLAIKVKLIEVDYPDDGYYILYAVEGQEKLGRAAIPNYKDTLVIMPSLLHGASLKFEKVSLRNSNDPQMNLGVFYLRFATGSEKQEFNNLVEDYKKSLKDVTDTQVKKFAKSAANILYGRASSPDLYNFLFLNNLIRSNE